ncbi:MAG: hypothetical protein J4F97_04730, partial [Pseudomonadales bacterium]|nr:hypothetical protein [Pseudomonadales bacterium]
PALERLPSPDYGDKPPTQTRTDFPASLEDLLKGLSSCFDDWYKPARPDSALGDPRRMQIERRTDRSQVSQT